MTPTDQTLPAERDHHTGPLLEIRNLSVRYLTEAGEVPACDDVTLTVRRGEILGIAGESASGKSTLLTALLRLQRTPAVTSGGEVIFHRGGGRPPVDLVRLDERAMSPLRWSDLSIVMQSAMACLNPVMRLRAQFADVITLKNPTMTRGQVDERITELLRMVGIAPDYATAYPHQLSGGMRQRSLIALALACDPDLVVMDEPTTAVDVVMQRTILDQVLALQERLGFAIIMVTHDLSLLLEISDRIAIMYGGRVVEVGDAAEIYAHPRHPYTQGLRNAFPPLSEPVRRLTGISGTPPNLLNLPVGCAFAPRCPHAQDDCLALRPELRTMPTTGAGEPGLAACLHPLDRDETRRQDEDAARPDAVAVDSEALLASTMEGAQR
ncbi:ABC transporter ATP-binding protein [Aestuariimicrobium sp. T2.26MG-19.2B]|uniref:ABC transporter ATP-binding protein n=1 Tax=Aestuariimicrobium sp. T2.26MG-19.2B TaxID=3040679 RepID=UPI0024777254|nr:ABC transporter ATP-binding protein [Aestuariimicrobium sp. T2.26MG-19.2B]CAI9399334.1 Oligopeptide transport ATP-binding protein OppD [Aestuariimicrobium sp. T2.26MG-19.2B]